MPVTTPTAKLTAKIFAQKRAADSYCARSCSLLRRRRKRCSSRPRYETVFSHATNSATPIVRIGKR
jgi:hypothetical protein